MVSAETLLQYDKSLRPCHRVQAADRCTVKLPTGPLLTKPRGEPPTSGDTLHCKNSAKNDEIFVQLKQHLEYGNLRTVLIIVVSLKV